MTGVKRTEVSSPNAETIEAWDGPLYERFVRFRSIVTAGLGNHGEAALELYPPQPGQRVIDVGCGFGDTTQRIAGLLGPKGHAVGVDVAPRFIEDAVRETAELGISNASFEVADVQTDDLGGPYDMAFSRMGVMFFNAPVPALRNVRAALVPGGRLCMVVWRSKAANDVLSIPEQAVAALLGDHDKGEHVTCGPGPFSMASADVVGDQLTAAGFRDITFERSDAELRVGDDLDAATRFSLTLGPAGERMRLAGEAAIARRDEVTAAVKAALSPFARPDGVFAPSSTWIVTATSR